MTTTLSLPPTLSALLEDDTYYEYFRRNIKLPKSISPNPAWQIMAQTQEGKWKRSWAHTFDHAHGIADKVMNKPELYRDVAIISRRRSFKMPAFANAMLEPGQEWCGRCRRPTVFNFYPSRHPALAHAPVIVENEIRCMFCGAREGIAQPWLVKK